MDRNLYGYGGEPRPPHSGARPFGDIHGVFQTEPTNAFATAASHGSQRAETSLSVAPSSARPRRDSRYYQARQSPPTPSYSYDGQVADQEATNTTTEAPGSPRRKYCSSPPPPFMKRAPKGTSFWDSSLADLGYYQDTGATASRLTQVANDASICKSPSAHFPSPSPSEGSADSAAKRSDSNTAHYQFDCSPQGPGCAWDLHRIGVGTTQSTQRQLQLRVGYPQDTAPVQVFLLSVGIWATNTWSTREMRDRPRSTWMLILASESQPEKPEHRLPQAHTGGMARLAPNRPSRPHSPMVWPVRPGGLPKRRPLTKLANA